MDSSNQQVRGPGLMPISLVAFAAIFYSLVPGGGTTRQATSETKALEHPGQSVSPDEDPLKPLYEFVDVEKQDDRRGKAILMGTARQPGVSTSYQVQFVIATVPDPVDSHLAQLFDRALDAIQRGMESAGYILDRFSLPWKRGTLMRWDASLPVLTDDGRVLSLTSKATSSDLHRRIPGMLLFRKPGSGQQQLVAVLLVGEMPTLGIQRAAFTAALNAIENFPPNVVPCLSCGADKKIQILGPYFSGTTESLRSALSAWNEKRDWVIQLVSGSATVDANVDRLGLPHTSFTATVLPDRVLQHHMFEFLHRQLGAQPHDIALFVEGGTVYGSDFKIRPIDSSLELRPRFSVSFPLHISQLRAAYDRDETLRNTGMASKAPRHALELTLEATDHDTRDVISAQDSQTALNIADLVITSGIETIQREKIRFVGILASDPRDVLFLARKIREAGATVTLFTFGTDILFTHPDYERYLRGLLVVSSYPLFAVNQAWTGTDQTRLAFPGTSEEGIYNAARTLVGEKMPLLDYGTPTMDRELSALGRRPPTWIMTVGHGAFWPVSVIESRTSPDDIGQHVARYVREGPIGAANEVTPRIEYHPPGAGLAFIIIEIFLVAALLFYSVGRGKRATEVRSRMRRRLVVASERVLSIWSVPAARNANRTYLTSCAILFLLVQAVIVVSLIRIGTFLEERDVLVGIATLILLCLILVTARECAGVLSGGSANDDRRPAWFGIAIVSAYLAGVVFILFQYWKHLTALGPVRSLAFYTRVFDLSSTVSPVLPFLFLVVVLCLWAACNLQRAYLLEVQGTAPEIPGDPELKSLAGFDAPQRRMRRMLRHPVARSLTIAAPIVAFIPFHNVLRSGLDTIDGQRWGFVLLLLFVSAYATIVYAVVLFLALWIELRRLLRRMAWHPAAEAFRRLPEELATTPWRMWRSLPNLAGLQAAVTQLRLLVNLQERHGEDPRWKALKLAADRADTLLNQCLRESGGSFVSSLSAQHALRRVLARAFELVLGELERVWSSWPGPAEDLGELRSMVAREPFLDVAAWVRRGIPAADEVWIRAAEEFVAIRMSSVIRGAFLQMKNLLTFSCLGFLFVLAAINSYPFEPAHPLMALVWVIAVVGIAAIAWALLGMNRDRVLSYIGKTKPGDVSISSDFIRTMAVYVVVPLLTLLATQFPGIGDFLFSIFSPAMKSVR